MPTVKDPNKMLELEKLICEHFEEHDPDYLDYLEFEVNTATLSIFNHTAEGRNLMLVVVHEYLGDTVVVHQQNEIGKVFDACATRFNHQADAFDHVLKYLHCEL